MALKATIFKADLSISDMTRNDFHVPVGTAPVTLQKISRKKADGV